MGSAAAQSRAPNWLLENGPSELESLVRAIVYLPSAPILVVDHERKLWDVSIGAGKLLGLPRNQIIGRQVDDFVAPGSKPRITALWDQLLGEGVGHREQEGILQLAARNGDLLDVEYSAKGQILPARHLLLLRAAPTSRQAAGSANTGKDRVQSWLQDVAAALLDEDGRIVAWYPGAERMYGHTSEEATGKHISFLCPGGHDSPTASQQELSRSASKGHLVSELWHATKDGSRFWAGVVTLALRDESGELRGFASVARDFTGRHERDKELRRSRALTRPIPIESAAAAVISGEFDSVAEANDAFLELVGYSREDMRSGRFHWPGLTPPEYFEFDELAHEEGLRFGACVPYEKKLLHKNGTLVPVLVTTAVLKLSPFRWITFLHDLREHGQFAGPEQDETRETSNFEEIVGVSAPLRRVLRQAEVVAPTNATVLILGETGTGKDLIACAIHRLSLRKTGPLITLNCAAIPSGLLESELFGYEKGAFTGALGQKIGRFEMARGGTLFLDEVGDIPLELQSKLLRALQEKTFERLGSTRTTAIDVRLIAATNRDLAEMMHRNLFRADLFYRLNVFPVTVPPLRDRPEDIPQLARHFTQKYAHQMGRQIDGIPSATMQALMSYPWPGNVRELENFIERSVILSDGPRLRAPLEELRTDDLERAEGTLEQVEREHILQVLRETGGVVSSAASRLGIPRTTLNARMRKYGISRKDFLP